MAIASYKVSISGDTTQLEKDVEKASSSSKSSFGSLFSYVKQGFGNSIGSSAFSAITSSAKSAVSTISSIATASSSAYANYEQLLGGVDKLFGDASSKVSEYANEAYKTAGLSANDYMDQVTSFSATLIAGLGGDTSAAADVANQAIVDMSDNANTFGSAIGAIQNAYQGFAKQNYAMLDNLKLGYGGTAAEMARLVNDSGVMGDSFTATASNINSVSFDKIIEAIHTVQENMGVAGTTANEASTTISGSLTQVSAAWQNVLTGLASGNDDLFKQAFDGLISSFSAVITNFSKLIPNIITGLNTLVTAITGALPGILQQILDTALPLLPGLLQNIVAFISTSLPALLRQLVDGLVPILPTLIDSIVKALTALFPAFLSVVVSLTEALVAALPGLVTGIINFLIQSIPQLIIAAIKLFTALIKALPTVIQALVAALPTLIQSIITTLIQSIPKLINASILLFYALITAIPQIIPQLVGAIPRIITSIVDSLKNGIGRIGQIGFQMIQGLMNGMFDFDIWGAISKMGKSIIGSFKSFFGIHSPSKLMASLIGENIGLGLGVGLDDSIPAVSSNIDDFNGSVTSQISEAVNVSNSTSVGGNTTVINQTVAEPKTKLDIALNTKKGIDLANGGKK